MGEGIVGVRRRWAGLSAAALLVAGTASALVAAAPPAFAAGQARYVATTGDDTDNDCLDSTDPCRTIAYAVVQAQPGDTVSIATGSYAESLDIRKTLTLVGAGSSGSGKTSITGGTGDQSGPSVYADGIDTETAPTVTLRNLDVSGNASDDGFEVQQASLVVDSSVVSDNDQQGIELAESELDTAQVSVTDSTISGNGQAGIYNASGTVQVLNSVIDANASGGVDVESGSASISRSTLNGNTGGGLIVDADSSATSTLDASTVSNTLPFAQQDGGRYGGGVLAFLGRLTVTNSTIAGNTGQGILDGGGTVSVADSTVSGTKPAVDDVYPSAGVAEVGNERLEVRIAGHAQHDVAVAAGTLTLTASVVAANTTVADCTGTITDGGYNLADDDSCSLSATGSKNSGTAKLGALQDNGGPTETMAPAKGSDAIDAIPVGAAGCSKDAVDQRGTGRPQGLKCDIGAVEVDQTPITVTPQTLPRATVGQAYSVTLTAHGGLGAPYEFSLEAGSSLPGGLSLSTAGVISGTPTAAGKFTFTVSVDDPTLVPFTIEVENEPGAPSTSTSTASTGPVIANTGTDVRPLGGWALLLLVTGVLLTIAGVRRYPARHRGH